MQTIFKKVTLDLPAYSLTSFVILKLLVLKLYKHRSFDAFVYIFGKVSP